MPRVLIFLPLLLLSTVSPSSFANSQSKPVVPKQQSHCQVIGKITGPKSKEVCYGLTWGIRDSAKMLCYSTLELVSLINGKWAKPCQPVESKRQAGDTRGTEVNAFRVLQPYGSVTVHPRPTISWEPLPGVSSYRLKVTEAGSSFFWYRDIQGTKAAYPADAPPLEAGLVYTIIVEPLDTNTVDSVQATKTLLPLSQAQRQKINNALATIQSLNENADERALDFERIYRGQKLYQDSIDVLENRVAKGSQNPEVFLVLGNRYQDEERLDSALEKYNRALEISTEQQRMDIKSKAEEALVSLQAKKT